MKNLRIVSSLLALSLIMAFGLSSCSKKTAVTKGSTELSIPFEGSKYRSDKDNFRARGTGTSPDLSTSKKIAMQNARTEMASNIESVIKSVTDQYTNQRTFTDAQEFSSRFEELSRNVVNQSLTGVRVMDEKVFQLADGRYQYWVALEMNKDNLNNSIADRVSREAALRQDYDKAKFTEIFDREMEELSRQRP
ncbi:MAG: LPP20 family lipoprotein [Cyclobacteriaceae bacterium]|nr:LPP20 family lipoprotein [Cyclobacteriaceae bacterium]MCH8516525.1 LPP20 family lipoprotein [Cyclobacteriaceae bacterium]